MPEISWNTKRCPYKNFWHSKTNQSHRKSWYSLPPLHFSYPKTFLDTKFSLNRRRVPLRFFGTARQKRSKENRDITILSIRNFDTRKKWNTTKGFSYDFFAHCDTKRFLKKIVALPSAPLLVHITFQYQKFLKHSRVLDEVYRFCETTVILKKIVDLPALAQKKLSIPETLWNRESFLYKMISYCQTKTFWW